MVGYCRSPLRGRTGADISTSSPRRLGSYTINQKNVPSMGEEALA